jgi:hypothetical protein
LDVEAQTPAVVCDRKPLENLRIPAGRRRLEQTPPIPAEKNIQTSKFASNQNTLEPAALDKSNVQTCE